MPKREPSEKTETPPWKLSTVEQARAEWNRLMVWEPPEQQWGPDEDGVNSRLFNCLCCEDQGVVRVPSAPRLKGAPFGHGHEETDEELAGFQVGPIPTFACPGCRPDAALYFLLPDRQRWANGSLHLPKEVYARLVRWMEAKFRLQGKARPVNKVRVWKEVSEGLAEWPGMVRPPTLDDAARLLSQQQAREEEYRQRKNAEEQSRG